MQLIKSIALLGAIASSAQALGINCEGSSECGFHIGGSPILEIIKHMEGATAAHGGDNVVNGQQIACSNSVFAASGGYCAFFQGVQRPMTHNDALNFLYGIRDHSCVACGSIPTEDGNDVNNGQLTVNFASEICPNAFGGDCLSGVSGDAPVDAGPPPPTTGDEPFAGGLKGRDASGIVARAAVRARRGAGA